MKKPTILVIIGSTRFKNQILGLTQRETLKGKIVINHGFFHHQDQVPITDSQKQKLDELMLRKIEIADEVLVANINDYVGESTKKGIAHAREHSKSLLFYERHEGAADTEQPPASASQPGVYA